MEFNVVTPCLNEIQNQQQIMFLKIKISLCAVLRPKLKEDTF